MATFRILSLDGGGIRGLLTAVLLEQLDAAVPGWRRHTDLIAGTSTGGIIALGLAHGLSPTDLRALYYQKGKDIFYDTAFDDIRDLGRAVGAEYDNRYLRRELERIFGDATLSTLGQKVLIPAFDLDNEDPEPDKRTWKPKFFHNFGGRDSDGAVRVADVALYTSAAPTYFPTVDGYIDGGVIANNPSMAALAQTQDRRARIIGRPTVDDVVLLSIGTGTVHMVVKGERLDWGYTQWARPLVQILFEGVTGIADYQCRQLLGERYRRLNHVFRSTDEIELDDWKARDRLVQIGEETMKEEVAATARWLEKYWQETPA
ncbi:patatin-like phospholipase family protein [Rhodocaloribacter litoris]|uniref:CBASS cGAMP-activated phospholipase n=1 Tax=Rhodocaloribacter litoris TaxID=2558931 RepID=UPI001423575C|nr:CBASS cGAMP-activated phospholipase [Rhodocaloribacter litoris]QXD16119.1 patatin-like phospholipase family protein [Rhodocaloribacter litoris]